MSIHELAFAKQSAKGTPATAATFRIPLVGGTVRPQRTVEILEETGTSRVRTQSNVMRAAVEGNPEYAVRPDALGLLLYAVLGAKAVAGAGDPYTHTFTNAAEQPWLTFWRQLENLKYEKFVDCKVTQLVLTSDNSVNGLRAAMTVMGLSANHLDSATYATEVDVDEEAGAPFMHYDGQGALGVEAPISAIERVALTINNQSTMQQGDSHLGYDVAEGILDLSVEVRALWENVSEYNRFHYGSATPTDGDEATKDVIELASSYLDFLWTRVAASPGPERSLRIQSGNRVQIRSLDGIEPNTNNDPVKKTTTYGLMRVASGSELTATLKNGTASY